MLKFFNRKLEVIVPRHDDNDEDIESGVIDSSIQSLMALTEYCSIRETYGYYNFSRSISYKFDYTPEKERRDNNEFVYSLYTLIATLLLYFELEMVHLTLDGALYEYKMSDLNNLQFELDKLLFGGN